MAEYPPVAGEFETVSKILEGRSIARFGDGELRVMEKHEYVREPVPVLALARELKRIARRPHRNCLIGIPTMDPAGTRYENWLLFRRRLMLYFNAQTRIKYVSSLITRPDCGAWMETREYYEHVIQIWATKRCIAIVSEADSKLLQYVRLTHPVPPLHVVCPRYGAFAEIERLEAQVLGLMPDIVLLSCGPTATALAHRLCVQGLQAIDLGSIGGYLLRWHLNQPQPTSTAEYWAERETICGPQNNARDRQVLSG
jgi:hypothetical protein